MQYTNLKTFDSFLIVLIGLLLASILQHRRVSMAVETVEMLMTSLVSLTYRPIVIHKKIFSIKSWFPTWGELPKVGNGAFDLGNGLISLLVF